jgi:nicotinamidase-related amidase
VNLFPTADDSVLVVVDVQERLVAAMRPEDKERVERNVPILLRAADLVGVPVLVTEQYPKGLGHTIGPVKDAVPQGTAIVEKVVFSCGRSDEFRSLLEQTGRRTVILTGMETHVCVLQTAFDLVDRGYSVHVASDAVCSRTRENREVGLDLLRQKGAAITSTETVAFQWVGQAGTDTFKAISKLVK